MNTQSMIKKLMKQGVYEQEKLFKLLYPTYVGHYSKLRDMISIEKNDCASRYR